MSTAERLVLRTCYLSLDDDARLRAIAFRLNVSKGKLIREAVSNYLRDQQPDAEQAPQGEVYLAPQDEIA